MNPLYTFVGDRANHRCEYCHAPELVFNFPFEVEHIVPIYLGGSHSESNLALACRSCNLRKGISISRVDPKSNAEVRLYNPRQDEWGEHFEVNTESGLISGKSAIGMATVDCLNINSQTQITARKIWIRLGLFP